MTSEEKMRPFEALHKLEQYTYESDGVELTLGYQIPELIKPIRVALNSVEAEKEPEWISCEERLPTEEDSDFNGDVIWWDPALDFPVVRGWSNSAYKDFSPFWMPTGLRRPAPPKYKPE